MGVDREARDQMAKLRRELAEDTDAKLRPKRVKDAEKRHYEEGHDDKCGCQHGR